MKLDSFHIALISNRNYTEKEKKLFRYMVKEVDRIFESTDDEDELADAYEVLDRRTAMRFGLSVEEVRQLHEDMHNEIMNMIR